MAILVVCAKCKARFQVSEKFAGQKGPCPKCKSEITVPDKSQEVKIHEPETFGPKGATGRAVLKPIFREETKWSPVAAGVIGGLVVVCFILAFVIGRVSQVEKIDARGQPAGYEVGGGLVYVALALGSLALAGGLSFGGYTLVRDSELEPYRGQELWVRVAACSVAYAALWGAIGLVKWMLPGLSAGDLNIFWIAGALIAMLAAGGGIGHLALDLEYLTGLLHYGMYLIVTVLMRVTMGLPIV